MLRDFLKEEEDVIWAFIDNLAIRHNISCSALARRSGLDATALNKSKRETPDGKIHLPSIVTILKICAATNTSWNDFVELMSDMRRRKSKS